MLEKSIEYLIDNANPSIKRRIKSEILHNLTPKEEAQYQEQILQEPIIQRIISCQKENGWLGNSFHGGNKNAGQFDNQEVGTKYLAEKAIDKDTPVLKRAMDAFVTVPMDDWCYGTRGKIYDEFKYAAFGMKIINCACIARAGYDDLIDITPQIQLSLDSFRRVLEVDSVLDISRSIRNGKLRVFNDNEKWPCRYHLDILAHTSSWKNEENVKMLADSIKKLMKTDRPELVGYCPVVWIDHPVGPLGGFPSQGLSIKTSSVFPSPLELGNTDFYNLEYIEWFTRCGVIPYVPALREAIDDIVNFIGDDGICRAPVLEATLKGWGPYAGLQLEVDWKSKTRKNCDITFRAVMIAHYSGIDYDE